ncbi:MAG: IS701 family transposase [Candidatus Dormibacteraeota bacterium]|uniref:IS701 family transposase n=1 Tax=Candidatus Aeolococcus gillhamiae TaxID=3127015 RepID=A0A934N2W7_9BACT|nr:IS701 family transposase [Candidatus Dormibacteraeota bacterium]
MNSRDLDDLLPELEAFHARFGSFFCRTEGRTAAQRYLGGLLLPLERKNVENIAEQVEMPIRGLQQFISVSPWDDDGCIDEVQRFVGEHLGAENGVLILDDTGFAKKGTWSAGVGRQYSGTLGRTDNCQVGVFLAYASDKGHTLVDRRLYLMRDWFEDTSAARRRRAHIPDDVTFHTKLELGAAMVRHAHEAGHLGYQWVTGDAAYGDSHDLRALVDALDRWYCFEVSSNSDVWCDQPAWAVPARRGGHGRPSTQRRPTSSSPRSLTVAQVAAGLDDTAWVRHRIKEGAKGPREYEFARRRVIEKRHRRPGPESWLMLRRPVGGGEIKFYLSNAPATMTLAEMAWTGCLRWTIEENFELAKGEVGLDHYEVTKLRGWYHHMTMSLMALAFLKSVQRRWGKKIDRPQRSRGAPAARGGPAARRMERAHRTGVAGRAAEAQGVCHRVAPPSVAA